MQNYQSQTDNQPGNFQIGFGCFKYHFNKNESGNKFKHGCADNTVTAAVSFTPSVLSQTFGNKIIAGQMVCRHIHNCCRTGNRSQELENNVTEGIFQAHSAGTQYAKRYGRINMRPRYRTDGISHCRYRQTESQSYSDIAHKRSRKYYGTATDKHQNKSSEQFCKIFFHKISP